MNPILDRRMSFMEVGPIYFWTATIKDWKPLLSIDDFKQIVVDSLSYLTDQKLMDIFGFVVMPNHVHFIWRANHKNGKEMPNGSILKFTAHEFKKRIAPSELAAYKVQASNKEYEFWQRDPFAVELNNQTVAYQKLDYIHANPVSKKWHLVPDPIDYQYSSLRFYEEGSSRFHFLRHLGEEF